MSLQKHCLFVMHCMSICCVSKVVKIMCICSVLITVVNLSTYVCPLYFDNFKPCDVIVV
jgi:hypothetical protein